MQHPFDLEISQLQSVELQIEELNDTEAEQIAGGKKDGKRYTTQALGEEGGEDIMTTLALGEEGGDFTTLALGEEGGSF